MDALIRNATGYAMTPYEASQARKMFWGHAATMMAFTAAYSAFLAQNSQSYREADPDEWSRNWLSPLPDELGGKKLRMLTGAGPFELIPLFKIGPEMLVRNYYGLDRGKDYSKVFKNSMWRDLAPPGAETPFVPFVAKPLMEAAINHTVSLKDSYPLGREDIAPALRGKGQSPFADALAFGSVSPAAIKHLGEGYFGEGFGFFDTLAKGIASTFGSKTARADLRDITEKVPWVKAMVTNPEKMDSATSYDFAEEQAMNRASSRYAAKRGLEGAAEYAKAGRYAKPAEKIKDRISDINTALERLRNSDDFKDADEAQRRYDSLQRAKERNLDILENMRVKAKD